MQWAVVAALISYHSLTLSLCEEKKGKTFKRFLYMWYFKRFFPSQAVSLSLFSYCSFLHCSWVCLVWAPPISPPSTSWLLRISIFWFLARLRTITEAGEQSSIQIVKKSRSKLKAQSLKQGSLCKKNQAHQVGKVLPHIPGCVEFLKAPVLWQGATLCLFLWTNSFNSHYTLKT